MIDPFGGIQNMLGQFQGFMNNPSQYIMQHRLNIPQPYMGNPQQAIQYLMNNGQMSQQQYNQLRGIARQIQSSPVFNQMIGRR